ncbi:hypothetical protein [Sphingomonas sp. SRS2]|uniref:hypothetical protein n=1 Tax=Sphingomonas sp. SRS2 TaxID=133190 RepID=UPI0006184746|nr:hypothetical protein [Sphingomonas sp. SRS2]KKC25831.1 hypothetical protein WP12_12325 [Sphingomonas sp. SRS2]
MPLYQPINYGAYSPPPDFAEAISSGLQVGQQFRQNQQQEKAREIALQNAQIAQERQRQKQEAYKTVLTNPRAGAPEYSKLAAMFPEDSEDLKRSFDMQDKAAKDSDLKQMSAVYGYLRGGQKDLAKQAIQARIDADRKAGVDTMDDERMLASIDQDGVQAANTVGYLLSALTGDKFGETAKAVGSERRADELQPAEVIKGEAEASKATTEAAFAPKVIATDVANKESQIQTRKQQLILDQDKLNLGWKQLALDEDTLATNTALKLQEYEQNGSKVEGSSLETLNKAVGSAVTNQALADRTKDLAAKLQTSSVQGRGFASDIGEWLAASTGKQDAVSALRGEYARIKNGIAIQNLPPGAASDADVKLAMSGFPPDTADKAYLVSWLNGVSKLQEIVAANEQAKADWISSNGNIGTAKRDLDVGGVRVPKGTTFGEFMKNRSKLRARNNPPAALESILQKYGGGN